MEKIDIASDEYLDTAKDGIGTPEALMLKEIVLKINEILDWINAQ